MEPRWTMGRRELFRAGGVVMLAAPLASCDLFSTDPASREENGSTAATKGKEAPALAELVAKGELPPIEERLPDDPPVVEPLERVGVYGGEIRTSSLEQNPHIFVYTVGGYDPLLRWKTEFTGAPGSEDLEANLAQSFEVNDEGTEFTFRLHPGVKWSDGEPFTADDIIFAVEDVFGNEELFPGPFLLLSSGDQRATATKADDFTVTITFAEPAGLFLPRLATGDGALLTRLPRHYLEQFHPRYNTTNLDQLMADEGSDDWIDLFWQKAGNSGRNWQNPDKPSLGAWKLVTRDAEGQRIVKERNPYYWKVDRDGSQLPYIDRVTFELTNLDVMILKTLSGDFNLEATQDTRFTTPANKPVFARDRDTGNYRFIDVIDTKMNEMNIYLNLTHADLVKREVFQNKDFRVGLSHAINRQELIDATLQRQGEPYQAAPVPESVFYDEEFATQYTEYNEDLANEVLDKTFPEKNSDGIRLGPDGNPISILMQFQTGYRPEWVDMLELIKGYWEAVGVEMTLNPAARELLSARWAANDFDADVWQGDGGLDVLMTNRSYLPTRRFNPDFGILWSNWYYRREPSEEPPEAPKRQLELWEQILSTVDPDEQFRLMTEILNIAKEEFYVIGTARDTGKYLIAANYIHNIPSPMVQGSMYQTPGPTRPEQYFIRE